MDKTKIAVAVFDQCANQYQDKFMQLDLYHDTFDLFCESVKKENARILELACGPGNITKYLLKKRPDFKILGTDLAPNMIALAEANNPNAAFELMDCRAIGTIGKKQDAIICGFGLPYLTKEESIQFIGDAAKILNPNGVFYISTMEDEYVKSDWKASSDGKHKAFIHYHQADYLSKAVEENGFEIVALERKDYPEQNGTFTKDLIIIAKKKVFP